MARKEGLPNPTHAKDIALYFLELTQDKFTSEIVARTVKQAKALLSAGYTKEEIIEVIDVVLKQNPNVYSLGYVSASINDVLRKINEVKQREIVEKQREEMRTQIALEIKQSRTEVTQDESTTRNREKARRASVQSRFGKKFDFDMFEE
jgi:Holliday junction resolvasome RuvABC DNA-binding subunit